MATKNSFNEQCITYSQMNMISQLFIQFAYAFRDLITAQLQGNSGAVYQNVVRLYAIAGNLAENFFLINPYINKTELSLATNRRLFF